MPENNVIDDQGKSDATLGGALFPMALGLMAGVLMGHCPVLEAWVGRTFAQNGREVLVAADLAQGSAAVLEVAHITEELKEPIEPEIVYKPNQWVINKSTSTLSFEALQYGQKFSGSFAFDGEIIFDPDALDEAMISIEIDIASIATGSITRDEQARTIAWFDVDAFPKATYKAAAFTKTGEGEEYIAHGVLNLRGIDVPLDLPFILRFSEEEGLESLENDEVELANTEVEAMAQISLKRSDFGIGQGEWENEDVISDKVAIFIVLQANKP